MSDERIIGTKGETATIFDTRTGRELMTLSPSISNQYAKNRAVFNPTDELVLSGISTIYIVCIVYSYMCVLYVSIYNVYNMCNRRRAVGREHGQGDPQVRQAEPDAQRSVPPQRPRGDSL